MKHSKHRQAIIIFSVVIPFLVFGAAFGFALHGRGKVTSEYGKKEADYEAYLNSERGVRELEAELAVGGRKEKIEYWSSKLEQDLLPTMSSTIARIVENFGEDVLKQNSISQMNGASSLAKSEAGSYSLISLSFEGGYKPMQLLMAELEAEMPQLVLEKLSITPVTNGKDASEGTGKLNFSIVYLAWKKRSSDTPQT